MDYEELEEFTEYEVTYTTMTDNELRKSQNQNECFKVFINMPSFDFAKGFATALLNTVDDIKSLYIFRVYGALCPTDNPYQGEVEREMVYQLKVSDDSLLS